MQIIKKHTTYVNKIIKSMHSVQNTTNCQSCQNWLKIYDETIQKVACFLGHRLSVVK